MERPDFDKLPGFYDEIPYPWDKKDELLTIFSDFEIEIHNAEDPDFEFQDERGISLIIKNPYGGYDIEIEMDAEFSLFFAGWHTHYFTYEYDYHQMIEGAKDIIAGRRFVAFLNRNGEWYGSSLEDKPITLDEFLNRRKDDPICPYTDEQIAEIKNAELDFQLRYWKQETDT